MPDPADLQAPGYTTELGHERIFVTSILDRATFDLFEQWRLAQRISRSEGVRRIISEHLSQPITTP
jgi:hypothetical protein